MDGKPEQISDQQRKSWNKFSAGWKKWDEWTMRFLKPTGDEIIRLLKITGTDQVLDVATGTGEPGQSIAKLVPKAKVTGCDISEGMLAVARENAGLKGISNYEAVWGDGCSLPFPENRFNAISCRMGFMFFPDLKMAIREMYRTLKPGGRLAISVWDAPIKNPWITTLTGTIGRHIESVPPLPETPGMFRCAAPGMITELLQWAGFRNISESEITGKAEFGSALSYWMNMTEVAAPIVATMSKADKATKVAIRKEVFEQLQKNTEDEKVKLDYASLIIYGEK
jgi:ubiquinone/menaquinone biosynthesis C-methylase UbiE